MKHVGGETMSQEMKRRSARRGFKWKPGKKKTFQGGECVWGRVYQALQCGETCKTHGMEPGGYPLDACPGEEKDEDKEVET